jgi:NAD(P)-dependent dehydrogenase (short-subunit alcohol dehydrogenase family)
VRKLSGIGQSCTQPAFSRPFDHDEAPVKAGSATELFVRRTRGYSMLMWIASLSYHPHLELHVSTSRRRPVTGEKSLAGAVAVVAGATRGAGRGIARALGEAGATVYGTGRSVRSNRSPYNRPETVEETAETIGAAGGSAIALRVDHTVEEEVHAPFQRVERERGRLDVLVNGIAGEDPLMAQWCSFWKTDLKNAEAALRQSLLPHIITAKYAAPYMIRNRRGLIVEVTENDLIGAGGNPVTQTVKLALKGLALNMAAELHPYGVAAVAVTPGFLRSGTMLERFGVTEETWREGGQKDRNFLESESPLFVGRAVVALALDPAILERSGQFSALGSSGVNTDSRTPTDGGRTGAPVNSTSQSIRNSCSNYCGLVPRSSFGTRTG